jgi:hypothetical protein
MRHQSVSWLRCEPFVVVVQTTETRNCDDRAARRCRDASGYWRIFIERQMRPRFQVVLDVGTQHAAQSTRVGDNDVIEALAANGSDQPLGVRVLPWRAWRCEDFLDADRRGRGGPGMERRISIVDQITCLVPGKRFAELLRRPRRRRMVRDRDVHDPAPLVSEDHEHEQQPARGCRDDEEIGSGELLKMVRQERPPRLRWRFGVCRGGRCTSRRSAGRRQRRVFATRRESVALPKADCPAPSFESRCRHRPGQVVARCGADSATSRTT